jgi:hypothetical protein
MLIEMSVSMTMSVGSRASVGFVVAPATGVVVMEVRECS